jgi:hypothetical protein
MGLFAAMLVASAHYPPGPIRTGLQLNAVYVLIPSLLPPAGALQGDQIDYASHFGGAIAGAAVGLVITSDELPPTNAEMSAHATELIARYPRDPRPRYLLAAELLDGRRGKTGSRRPFRRSSLAPDIASTTCRWLAGDIGNCA